MATGEAICRQCGKTFTRRIDPSVVNVRGFFCGLRCFHDHNTQFSRQQATCANCGKPFTPNRVQARALGLGAQKRVYCSRECSIKHIPAKRAIDGQPNSKGGIVQSRGYIYEREERHAVSHYVAQHRKVLEKELGRLLRDDEIAHHINGDTKDNRPENLMVLTRSEHMKLHDEQREKKNGRFISERV